MASLPLDKVQIMVNFKNTLRSVETQNTDTKNGFALIEPDDELVRQTRKENRTRKFY
jgi:hypothetical protein